MRYGLLVIFAAAVIGGACQAAEPKVLIVSIDGCRVDAFQIANTPNVDALIDAGGVNYDARNTMTHGSSGPNYSSMFTGVTVARHGVTSNSYDAGGFIGNHFDVWPHFFSRLKTYDPSLYLASFVGWAPINPGTWADRFADRAGSGNQASVASQAAGLLAQGDPDVVFVQFPGVDSEGHASGFSPTNPRYIAAIEQADRDYATILSALRARPGYIDGTEAWLIITTTDHGGLGTHHDLPSGGEAVFRTFWVSTGPSVKPGSYIDPPTIYDVPVTAMEYLGLGTAGMGLDGRRVVPIDPTPGDADSDRDVDFTDYLLVKANFDSPSGMRWRDGDFDADGDVDFYDYLAAKANFGWTWGGAGSPAPGPAAAWLLAAGAAAVLRRRPTRGRRRPRHS